MKPTHYIFDFDSTFTQVEAMEELAEISLENDPDKELIIEKIKQLTDMAMDGTMPFNKSLRARIALLSAKKYHLTKLVNKLRKRVSPSFIRNKQFFKENQGNVFILSGGFKEFIVPIVKPYFIDSDHVFANTFVYDQKNQIIGADESNLLAQNEGKVKLLKQLKLPGKIVVIGDGYTDYQVYESGLASTFFAFTENIGREKVLKKAEQIAPSLDEILFTQKLPMSLSYPKTRLKIVFWGDQTFGGISSFRKEGYKVVQIPDNGSRILVNKEILDAHMLVFSSHMKTKSLALSKSKLLAAGIWGEPRPETDLFPFTEKGIVVFGSNFANTRSISELALLMLLSLNRRVGEELPGKRLGIIGYNHAGSMISLLTEQLGMDVYYFDQEDRPPLGKARKLKQVNELLRKCQYLVITPDSKSALEIRLGSRELKQMLPGSFLLNLCSDESVNLEACKEALVSGKLAGFGVDFMKQTIKLNWGDANVYSSYQQRMNTRQTQQNISETLGDKIIDFINLGNTQGSLNFPPISLPPLQHSHRFIHIHENKSGVLSQINGILAKHQINISAQHLHTNEHIGFVITDVSKKYPNRVLMDLKSIQETIKFRVLY